MPITIVFEHPDRHQYQGLLFVFCPVHVLDSKLAGGQCIGHWNPRARIRINLGFSPRHARNVYNVLNVNTATVSPQFHVKLDDFFETVSAGAGNAPVTTIWQTVAGFIKGKPTGTILSKRPNQRLILKLGVRGNRADYLGINFSRRGDGKIFLSQPQLIQQIIDDVGVTNH